MRDRVKSPIMCGCLDYESGGGGRSDMEINDVPEDAGYPFAESPKLSEMLLKEGKSDKAMYDCRRNNVHAT